MFIGYGWAKASEMRHQQTADGNLILILFGEVEAEVIITTVYQYKNK